MAAEIDSGLNKIVTIQIALVSQMGHLEAKRHVGMPKVKQLPLSSV